MEWFPLAVFPHGALSSSVTTTVWVGILVVAFFNLRFGWVLSGLVVPGYIVPLLIVKPWAAAVILLEGGVTYALVWLMSDYLSRLGYWSGLFGRDRFFALILVSIAVRVLFDGWLLPVLGQWLVHDLGIAFDYRGQLHSFGLIVITLIANQFWKSGFVRGIVPLLTVIGVTYLIVRYGLMSFTNFTVSNLSYMYEDLAASILASPKAYIILIITAFIASRMNLLYGWDFSGILIPSLLALQWYQPQKILATFVESFVILFSAYALLSLKWFRNTHIEGARKIVFFFNIGFAYKFILAYVVLWFDWPVKITDAYGFGYLLATLMAIKMHDKEIAAGLTRATLQTSLVSVAIASVIGLGLTFLPLSGVLQDRAGDGVQSLQATSVDEPPDVLIQRDKLRLYQVKERGTSPQPLTLELERFEQAMRGIRNHLRYPDKVELGPELGRLAGLGYEALLVQGRYLYLREHESVRGWGSYLIDTRADNALIVQVPAPLDETGTLSAALELFHVLKAQALVVAGTARKQNPDGSSDVLLNRQSFFHVFHRVFGRHQALQVRSRAVSPVVSADRQGIADDAEGPRLWLASTLPEGLDLPLLKRLLGHLRIQWGAHPEVNRQREIAREGFAELVLDQEAIRGLRARAFRARQLTSLELGDMSIDGYLREWVLGVKQHMARRGSDAYRAPGRDELLYFDEEVLTPLYRLLRTGRQGGVWTAQALRELELLDGAARVLGYRILRYHHRGTGREFLMLFEEAAQGSPHYWGTYVFRADPDAGYLVQVPRPLHEISSLEYGLSLFEDLRAESLSIAGTHPDANLDGSADLVLPQNMQSLFSLVSQVWLRESREQPMLIIHARARGYRESMDEAGADVYLAFHDGRLPGRGLPALAAPFLDALGSEGATYRFVDGSPETSGYEVGVTAQSLYLQAARNKSFCVLWASPETRAAYRQQQGNVQEALRFSALGIATEEAELYGVLRRHDQGALREPLEADFVEAVLRYITTEDIVSLRRLQDEWKAGRLLRVIDRDSRQSFLVVLDAGDRLLGVMNLHPLHAQRLHKAQAGAFTREDVERFIRTRAGRLVLEAGG